MNTQHLVRARNEMGFDCWLGIYISFLLESFSISASAIMALPEDSPHADTLSCNWPRMSQQETYYHGRTTQPRPATDSNHQKSRKSLVLVLGVLLVLNSSLGSSLPTSTLPILQIAAIDIHADPPVQRTHHPHLVPLI